jgi:NAD(P)H-hydrate epimerase
MKEILSVENMRNSDAETISGGTTGRELMMRAGRAVFDNTDWKPPVAIICGSGNNAGDGYVIASLLFEKGIETALILLEDRFSGDGRFYYDKCREQGVPVRFFEAGMSLCSYKTIVDCIFGTGFHGAVKGKAAEAIGAINKSGAYVVSVDINSGLNGNTGIAEGEEGRNCVISDITASIGSFKPGHFLNMAKDVMRHKANFDIGIKPVEKPYHLLESKDIKPYFGKRNEFSNKGDYGYIALIGGSKRYSGAIRLASMANAAMRAGAGVVKVAVPNSLFNVVASNVLESTLFPLSDNDGEIVFCEEEIAELIKNVKTVAFGMGIGVTGETGKVLEYLLKNYTGTLIIDADGLTLLSKTDRETVKASKAKLVLTPHIKEFSRLTGLSKEEILAAPVENARKYAEENGVILLLKGPATIVTDGKDVLFNDTGCSGMATAGSGDVLSGILSAVCAYIPGNVEKAENPGKTGTDAGSLSPLLLSVAAGAYINGRAGEIAQKKYNSVSMVAGDTVAGIAEAVTGLIS